MAITTVETNEHLCMLIDRETKEVSVYTRANWDNGIPMRAYEGHAMFIDTRLNGFSYDADEEQSLKDAVAEKYESFEGDEYQKAAVQDVAERWALYLAEAQAE